MTPEEVREAYEMGEYLTHPSQPNAVYQISLLGECQFDGIWLPVAIYSDALMGGDTYVRRIDDFEKFQVLFS